MAVLVINTNTQYDVNGADLWWM